MRAQRPRRNHHATVVAYLALFIALGGSSYAAIRVGSAQIADNSVRSVDIRNNALRSEDVRDGSLLTQDFKAGRLPAGPTGAQGPRGEQGAVGPTGAQGPTGDQGPSGSPDTSAQILDKLKQVDGSGSGLDADSIDGVDAASLVRGTAAISLIDEVLTDPDGAGGAKGFSATVTVPGASIVAACLQQSSGIEMFLTKAQGVQSVHLWRDDGATNPATKTLVDNPMDPTADSDSAPVSGGDRIIWHGASSAGTFTAVLLTAYTGIGTCRWSGYVIKSA